MFDMPIPQHASNSFVRDVAWQPISVMQHAYFCSWMRIFNVLSRPVSPLRTFPPEYTYRTFVCQCKFLIHRMSKNCNGDIFFGWVKRTISASASSILSSVHESTRDDLQCGLMMCSYLH